MDAEKLLKERRQAIMKKGLRVYLARILGRMDRILEYTAEGGDPDRTHTGDVLLR